jgi:hypothetical protein
MNKNIQMIPFSQYISFKSAIYKKKNMSFHVRFSYSFINKSRIKCIFTPSFQNNFIIEVLNHEDLKSIILKFI